MKEKVIKHINLLFLLKVSIGSAAAILIANQFGLLYSPSAGIITLLTIQNTKKETLTLALKRFIAFALAVIISYLVFQGIGYTAVAFGGFVFLFVALCLALGLKEAISMNAVLMTHFLIEKRMDVPLVFNELGLLCVGMLLGIVLNLIMPSKRSRIRKNQLLIEEDIKEALKSLAKLLRGKEACLIQGDAAVYPREERGEGLWKGIDFNQLEVKLEGLLRSAYEEADNTLLNDTKYLISYLEMRKLQLSVLKDIKSNIKEIPVILKQTYPVAEFIDKIAESFHELNNTKGLLEDLEELKEHYRKEELPQTREEFEYRATLFQILKELEYFLWIKRNFIIEIKRKNIQSYWNDEYDKDIKINDKH
ncbi:MAG TPA: aromatic acid exporter family protein [Clostridiales bacterium]|nr:aromatic acid exporter family protein [Clostridiales bacterium]